MDLSGSLKPAALLPILRHISRGEGSLAEQANMHVASNWSYLPRHAGCDLGTKTMLQWHPNTKNVRSNIRGNKIRGISCCGRSLALPPHSLVDNVMQIVGSTIRRYRLAKGYSQEGFAQWAQIDRSHYGKIERGDLNISILTLCQVAAHLGVSPSAFLAEISPDDCLRTLREQPRRRGSRRPPQEADR